MSATIFTAEEAEKAKITIITDEQKGRQAVHDVVVAMQANRRRGTACAKTKGEVNHSGAKPWRQKGTGRARAGDKASPIWVGGGVVFGPRPRDYSKNVPKKVKVLAFRKALSERILAGDVLTVDTFAVKEAKTKTFLSLVASNVKDAKKILVVGNSFDEKTYLAGRNVKNTLLARAADLNTEQLLAFDKIILNKETLSTLSERLAS
ncbi:50S ribosomal protein L4 [soil metagenome]